MPSLLDTWSIEVSTRDRDGLDVLRGRLAGGSDVTITFLPGDVHQGIVEMARAVRAAGFNPVPHVAARQLASLTQLRDYLERAAGEAGATRVLVIGGDAERPRGPFAATRDLLETELLQACGIRSVGFAGHPEGSTRLPAALLDAALAEKLALARRVGLEPWVATQFCFEAPPILAWLAKTAAFDPTVPVRIGIAGPASIATLLKFAVKCGIGPSLRALRARPDSVTRLLGQATPDRLLRDLAAGLARTPDPRPLSLHLFPFGGLARTLDWMDEARQGGTPTRARARARTSG